MKRQGGGLAASRPARDRKGGRGERSRGQLLLVAGLVLALTFVVLGVFLNAIIGAETTAIQERHGEVTVPVRYVEVVERGIGGAVFFTNYYDLGANSVIRAEHATWTANASSHFAVDGVATKTAVLAITNGTQVFQDESGTFTDVDGTVNWTLATGVSGVRRFTMNVSRDSLVDPGGIGGALDLLNSDAFRVKVDNGSAVRSVVVYKDGSDIVVEVVNETGASSTIVGSCRSAGEHAVIDLTQGRLDGESCDPLEFPGLTGTYAIEYVHADQVEGRYVLVLDRPPEALPSSHYNSHPGGDPPLTAPAIYSVTLDVEYRSASLNYTRNLTVAPAEPPPGKTYSVAPASIELVYTSPGGRLHSIDPDGEITTYAPASVAVIGPMEVDFDGDGLREIPYVNASGHLKLVDRQNETQFLASSAATSNSLLGVGTWGNASFATRTAVYYVNSSDGTLYRAWWNETAGDPERQLIRRNDGDGDGISAVGGIADFNGDGDADIVFVDGSAMVTYIDGGTTHETGTTIGSGNGIGIGEPKAFEDGVRAPIVDTSGNVGLLRHDGSVDTRTSSGPATKSPVAGVDWNASASGLEIVYIDSSEGRLYYVTQSGTKVRITDSNGDPVEADDDQGVA